MDEATNVRYNYNNSNTSKGGGWFALLNVIFVIISLFIIYYLYKFLYTSSGSSAVVLYKGTRPATTPLEDLPAAPKIYEGGDYSINTWIYVTGVDKTSHSRKHIFELRGEYFSTLVIALGAFNNSLVVRTCTESGVEGFATGGSAGSRGSSSTTNTSNVTPNSSSSTNSLTPDNLDTFFKPMTMDDSLLTSPVQCDIPEIDLQRWVMVTVVLSGRTTDIYIDGKLRRSCINSSFFKVDPTGVKPVMTLRSGYDGYTGTTSVANYPMNPDEIYKTYLSGPAGSSVDILSWIISIFKGNPAN